MTMRSYLKMTKMVLCRRNPLISKIVELHYTLAEFFEYSGSTLIGWGWGL